MNSISSWVANKVYLHSTLVIFKLNRENGLGQPVAQFTFHFGYIQIKLSFFMIIKNTFFIIL